MNILKLFALFCALFSSLVKAGIEFTSDDIKFDVEVAAGLPDIISKTFKAQFRTSCSPNCDPAQDFRLGFSNESQNDDGDFDLEIDDLHLFVRSPVSVLISGGETNNNWVTHWNREFNVGGWTDIVEPDTDRMRYFEAEFTINLDSKELFDYLDGNDSNDYKFYIIAQDVEGSKYSHYLEVEMNIIRSEQVQISGLQDVVFHATNATGDLSEGFDLCVYSSTGDIRIDDIVGSCNSSGNRFMLGPSGVCSGNNDSNAIRYRLIATYYRNGQQKDRTFKRDGHHSNGNYRYDASKQLYCGGGTNMRFDIEIDDRAYQGKPAGVYTDTLTVTISPG